MSISSIQNSINTINRELSELSKQHAEQVKKESDLVSKVNRAQEALRRTSSSSVVTSKLREIERATKDLATVQSKRVDISKKIAEKTKRLHGYQQQLRKEEERARKKVADEQKQLQRDREAHERRITTEIRNRKTLVTGTEVSSITVAQEELHDFFISHASEDKEAFVRALAEALQDRGAKVWYDEFTLQIGDSLRRTIDRGLRNSRFGIVVLSEYFFAKEWPQRELDGLVALETQGQTRILPIWHKVTKDDVAHFSPTLADKVGLNTTTYDVEKIVDHLMRLLN